MDHVPLTQLPERESHSCMGIMGVGEELVAVRVMAVTTGLLGLFSNENTAFSLFFSNAVMLGIPPTV